MISVKDAPYTGPYFGPSSARGPNKGPTAKALKRAMIRMGLLEATLARVDEHYNKPLETAIKKFQRSLPDIQNTGQYGRGTWIAVREAKVPAGRPNSGQPALDEEAQRLIRREYLQDLDDADPVPEIRAAITDFCKRAELNEGKWHYTQRRPYLGVGDAPEVTHYNDCSSYVILCYAWAADVEGVAIPDPSGFAYNGYGNTWDDLDGHPKVSGQYLVGDLAHYDGHVTICKKAGDFRGSLWSSFGSEGGPDERTLFYRDDFWFVVRPKLVP